MCSCIFKAGMFMFPVCAVTAEGFIPDLRNSSHFRPWFTPMSCLCLPKGPWGNHTLHLCLTSHSIKEPVPLSFSVLYLHVETFAAGIVCFFVQFVPASVRRWSAPDLPGDHSSSGSHEELVALSPFLTKGHPPEQQHPWKCWADFQENTLQEEMALGTADSKKHRIFSSFSFSCLLI